MFPPRDVPQTKHGLKALVVGFPARVAPSCTRLARTRAQLFACRSTSQGTLKLPRRDTRHALKSAFVEYGNGQTIVEARIEMMDYHELT